VKVPTTHGHADGVAAGIVEGLRRVLECDGVRAADVAFVAHSTTQATNALLEGDVARVGVVGLVGGTGAFVAAAQLRLGAIVLAPNATFAPATAFARDDDAALRGAVDDLLARGCEAIAASEAFGVDRPARERRVVEYARQRGVPATSGHEVASSYGLRARTRTAALNAAILPTMIATARMTADAARRGGINAALMIMRSDGGVMDVAEVERRPILTILSGPAAGVAGALLHENVTDGIFIEVGGTSSDLSVVRRGRPQMRPAQVGGHRTMLRTLDVRTLGIAGGSLLRLDPRGRGVAALRGVGPRSAHIAGMRYASFTPAPELAGAEVRFVGPKAGDLDDCAVLRTRGGEDVALTPTCAANALGLVQADAFARGDAEAARLAFALVGARVGMQGDALARALLERAAAILERGIDELIADYELERRDVELVGGGGGAAALIPFVADKLGMRYRIARDAEVISPIGVALALVRDVVERTIPNPTADDVVRVRREAFERVVAAGAAPELVETTVELEPRRNLVRATASGGTAAASPATAQVAADPAAAAARALHVAEGDRLTCAAKTAELSVFTATRARRRMAWLPLRTQARSDACVVDAAGVVRAVARGGRVACLRRGNSARQLTRLLEDATAFGDVGRALPDCTLVYGRRIADLSGLAEAAQVVALAEEELRGLDDATPVVAIVTERAT
jgi:N-methylhydantoinase A